MSKRPSRFTPLHRHAGLIDFENITYDSHAVATCAVAEQMLRHVRPVVDGMLTTLALQARLAPIYLPILDGPWSQRWVPSEPDAADHELLREAHHYVSLGVTDLVIVSGDGIFAQLSGHCRLHVFARRGRLSRSLRMAATSVTFLDLPIAPLKTA